MNRNISSLVLLLFTVALYSQVQKSQVRIIYKVSLKENKNDSSLTKEQKTYNNYIKKFEKENYFLDIMEYESIFYKEQKMNVDESKKLNLVSIFVGKGSFYYNLKDKVVLNQKEVLGEKFIVKSNPNYKWKLLQERREIGGYNCYKALTTKSYINRKGDIEYKQIVAWYTSEIPINIGIKDYHNLPGLILFLEEDKLYYELHSINLNHKSKIEKPSSGKMITEKEYHNIMSKSFNYRF